MALSPEQLAKPLKVTKRIQETRDAISLVLEVPSDLQKQFHYQAGQFVTFFMNIDGQSINRSYSLSSSPLVDKEFKITVKKLEGGRGSTFLCDEVKEGDTLLTTPPAGTFFKPSLESKGTHYVLFAAGSGITPLYSIMKTVLNASPQNRVSLIYGNRNLDSVIYRDQLDGWAKEHAARLNVVHVLSKPDYGWVGRTGRIDRTFITEFLEMPLSGPTHREYYLCGPVEFMHLVRNTLVELGVPKDAVKEENFGVAVHKPHIPIDESWTFIGHDNGEPAQSPEKIVAKIDGKIVEVAAKEGQSILETLIEAGEQPPYSCMDGSCMACLGKVQEGRVYQSDPGILADENIENGECLTCQAKPLSRIVRISYDDL